MRRNAAQLPKLPAKTTPRRDFATSNLRLTNSQRLIRAWRQPAFRSGRQARYNSTKTSAEEELGSNAPQSLSERMKAMSRKYGWIVVGIYLGLSVLDFPFCFLAVRWFGTERIANLEHAIIDGFWSQVEKFAPSLKEKREAKEAIAAAEEAAREGSDAVMKEAKKEGDASTYSLVLSQALADTWYRHLDSAASRLWRTQIAHLLPNSHHARHHTESGQDAQEVGMEHRQAEAEVRAACSRYRHRLHEVARFHSACNKSL